MTCVIICELCLDSTFVKVVKGMQQYSSQNMLQAMDAKIE